MILKEVKARSILDSRSERTIEVFVNGAIASSPSGKSTGIYESKTFYKSLDFCIKFLNSWNEEIEIDKFGDLEKVEKLICSRLKLKKPELFGGNSLFGFESAILKALACEQKKELWQVVNPRAKKMPVPVGNAIGGGLHSSSFKVHPIFQEFLLIPKEKSFLKNFRTMKEVYEQLGRQFNAEKINDEGAWHVAQDDEAILKEIFNYRSLVDIGVDFAASSFFEKGLYQYHKDERTPSFQVKHIIELAKLYGVFYLEDPVEQNDFAGFKKINREVSNSLIVGDDLTATHLDRIKKAHSMGCINAVIVKPNQHGSLLHLKDISEYCKKHKIVMIFSHRSGETLDDSLADYAFGFSADYIKCGIATKWREAKLNRLIEIEKIFKY
ncbi:MAG: hypothetical protein AABW79_00030 [Nanoarchaeota archaeon]